MFFLPSAVQSVRPVTDIAALTAPSSAHVLMLCYKVLLIFASMQAFCKAQPCFMDEPSSHKIKQTDLVGLRQLAQKVQGIHQFHDRLGNLGPLPEIVL